MTVIELSDERAAALKAKASALGLTLEAWFDQLASDATPPATSGPTPHIAELICESMREMPVEIAAAMPKTAPVSTIITSMAGRNASHERSVRRHVLLDRPNRCRR